MTDIPMSDDAGIRPLVRVAGSNNRSIWLFGAAALLGGLLLFSTLNDRRQAVVAATAPTTASEGGILAAPPPLNIPQDYTAAAPIYAEVPAQQAPMISAPPPQVITRVVERVVPAPYSSSPVAAQPDPEQRAPVVIQRQPSPGPSAAGSPTNESERVTAGRLLNPAFTVPKGTIIAAVLETALDSTRAGAVRAIVSRDVKSFDGSRVLIPRGSQLYGEYSSDLSAGQKRALVRWQRLTRPDAVIINLDSPAADPLGRAGVQGKVDSHFFERFGGAILQSTLDIGVAVASRSIVDYPILVALPGSTQNVARGQQSSQVTPTLRVQQGTSMSVFIARDLDFSTVDR